MSIADQIITYKEWDPMGSYRDYLTQHAGGRLPDIDTILEPPVLAYVNQGRWIGECPNGCGDARILSLADPYFYCGLCRDGWRAVTFPADREEIEVELLKRPLVAHLPMNRNWTPSESLGALQSENARHGIS